MAEAGEWVVVSLDERAAQRHGMPQRIPAPKAAFEELGLKGLTHDTAQEWIRQFIGKAGAGWRAKNPADAKRYDAYLAKMGPWQKAQAAFARQNFEQAIKSLVLVTNVDPEDAAAKQSLATVYAAAGRAADALALFEAVKEVFAGVAEYHVAYANALLMDSNKESATAEFVLALEADPECRPAMNGLVTLGVLVKIYEDPLDPKSLIFVRSDAVAEYLEGVWQAEPRDLDYYLLQAGYHEDERRYGVMLAAAELAQNVAPEDPRGAVTRVRALRHLGRLEEAVAAAAQAVERWPTSATPLVEQAYVAVARGDEPAATLAVDRALLIEPGHLTALDLKFFPADPNDLAALAEKLPSLQQFAADHAEHAGVWRSLARAKARLQDEAGMRESFHKALSLAPEDDDLRAEFWTELEKVGRFQDVLDDADKLGQIGGRDWKLRWSEAEAYLGLGKKDQAKAAFMAINADTALHVSVRARAKRAFTAIG